MPPSPPWCFDADQRIMGSWHEVAPSATQASQNRQNTVAHWVEKWDYRTFERLWARAQSSWVRILLPIFVQQIRIYNAKRLWDPMEKPSKHLTVFSPETRNIKKLANLTANTKNYGQITLTLNSIQTLFYSYLYYFAEAIVEAWSSKIVWYFYSDISAGSNGNFGGKGGRISECRVCSFWKIVPMHESHKVLSICAKPKHYKNSNGVFDQRSKCWNTLGRFQQSFLWILNVLIIHEFLTAGYLVLWTTVPVSRGFHSIQKLREFVHNKSKTLFRIASHFCTNIEYSHRVRTSIFVEIILWELTPESEYEIS